MLASRDLTARRLPMRFDDWVARTKTCAEHIAAIRSLQSLAPSAVREHFAIADDGSFSLDTVALVTHGV